MRRSTQRACIERSAGVSRRRRDHGPREGPLPEGSYWAKGTIEKGRKPLVAGEEGYEALELVDAIYRSCRTGEKVAL